MQAALASLHAVRHWVFDLDGTLTEAVHDFEAIRRELGIPSGALILEHIAARPAPEAQRLRERLDAIERELCDLARPAEGALELLAQLSSKRVRLGILTRNAQDFAVLTLARAGLGQFFAREDIIGRDEATPKPSSEGLVLLSRRWGVPPTACAMIGDYRFDLEVGRAVGAVTVHVDPTGAFAWPELTDVAVRSLRALLR